MNLNPINPLEQRRCRWRTTEGYACVQQIQGDPGPGEPASCKDPNDHQESSPHPQLGSLALGPTCRQLAKPGGRRGLLVN